MSALWRFLSLVILRARHRLIVICSRFDELRVFLFTRARAHCKCSERVEVEALEMEASLSPGRLSVSCPYRFPSRVT